MKVIEHMTLAERKAFISAWIKAGGSTRVLVEALVRHA
jgi:hypothetical protein